MIKRFIRIGGFVSKEIREIVRQPRLILSLLLGPFLILLIFGAGYVGPSNKLSAILVIPDQPAFTSQAATLRQQFGTGLNVVDVTTDLPAAEARLQSAEVDVVIQIPGDAAQQIGAGAQAIVPVFYSAIDPINENRVILGTLIYTNELNKETVAAAFARGQAGAGDVQQALGRVDTALGQVSSDMQRGDVQSAGQRISDARTAADAVTLSAGLMLQLLQAAPAAAPGGQTDVQRQNLARTQQSVQKLNTDIAALQAELQQPSPNPATVQTRVDAVRGDVREVQGLTAQFQHLNPYVLAAPFFGQARNLALAGSPSFVEFYTPGVIALLLQHIAVTLGALSMVRERTRGSVEIFRVSPITPGEILTGKYIGFLVFLGILSAALIALAIYGLGVPMLGSYLWLSVSLLLLIFASLGLGFALSMVSQTESQAVQLAMLALLTAVFFGGFFLTLDSFWAPVLGLSYALPVTHGIISLQDIMLRGRQPNWFYPGMLLGLGIVFAAFSMWRFAREFRRG